MTLVSSLRDFIASGFASIPEVERVYTAREAGADVVYVRVGVRDPSDRDLRFRIYAKEKEIIGEFHMFNFDFDIFPTELAPPDPSMELAYSKI